MRARLGRAPAAQRRVGYGHAGFETYGRPDGLQSGTGGDGGGRCGEELVNNTPILQNLGVGA